MIEYVEPVRYIDDEPEPEKRYVGFKRWVVVVLLHAASWYMHSIGAIAYSVILFLVAYFAIFVLTLHLWITKPRDPKVADRRDLLDRWSK